MFHAHGRAAGATQTAAGTRTHNQDVRPKRDVHGIHGHLQDGARKSIAGHGTLGMEEIRHNAKIMSMAKTVSGAVTLKGMTQLGGAIRTLLR